MRRLSCCVAMVASVALTGCSGGSSSDGGGGGSCTNTCSTANATQCSGTQVQTCLTGSDGCLAWSAPAACPDAGLCSASANACVADPCGGMPVDGVCASASTVSYCGVPTGEGAPRVLTYACSAGESCQVQSGKARCVITGDCRAGTTECVNATTLRTCNAGSWGTTTCSSACRATTLGASCGAAGALKTLTGTVLYEARTPNVGLTDWASTPNQYYAPLFLVLSRGAGGLYDAVYTSAAAGSLGTFSIQVPEVPGPEDRIVVAAAADDGAGGLAFAVASPGFATSGEREPGTIGTPALWSWVWQTGSLTNGQNLVITEAMGSGAANVYFNMLVAYAVAYDQYQRLGPSLIVWVGSGATWTCGACFGPFPTTAFGLPFASQIWIGASPTDQAYWSDAVNEHELGHWAMASFGASPGEGGPHFLGRPTFPGQAWSEGWATWFSSAVRGDSLYYDKQSGSFFWMDIAGADYSSGSAFVQPRASDGLLQLLDENEVAAMMWRVSRSGAGAADAVFQALASPRMTTPVATRGYTRHRWGFDNSGNFVNVVDTGVSAPSFGDFLDALNCAGFSRASIDAATIPGTQFPYPSATPICN